MSTSQLKPISSANPRLVRRFYLWAEDQFFIPFPLLIVHQQPPSNNNFNSTAFFSIYCHHHKLKYLCDYPRESRNIKLLQTNCSWCCSCGFTAPALFWIVHKQRNIRETQIQTRNIRLTTLFCFVDEPNGETIIWEAPVLQPVSQSLSHYSKSSSTTLARSAERVRRDISKTKRQPQSESVHEATRTGREQWFRSCCREQKFPVGRKLWTMGN